MTFYMDMYKDSVACFLHVRMFSFSSFTVKFINFSDEYLANNCYEHENIMKDCNARHASEAADSSDQALASYRQRTARIKDRLKTLHVL